MAFPLSTCKRTLPVHFMPKVNEPKVTVHKSCYENQSKFQITAFSLFDIQTWIDFFCADIAKKHLALHYPIGDGTTAGLDKKCCLISIPESGGNKVSSEISYLAIWR